MNTTIYDSGLFCNHLSPIGNQPCKGKILRRYSSWIEHGEPLNPFSPPHNRSDDDCYCERCGAVYFPDIIIQRVKDEAREMEIISQDPPPPPAEPKKADASHVDLFRLQREPTPPVIPDMAKFLKKIGVSR